ncbi:MFS transporter [Deinococcus peraridilitoris]|uniref:Sugar phosphate permease n=1 Tax=Deinococcus peraridilitoris (strain DSM 19664 / LMG 22246 / CIP 109416 / KR-200) TaxID=937777 RepID=K9ZWL9_DEIPD|nr:MFS transporter [Deinococcus peraridilitoris]AFZ65981.1 sugar phosphate permease [Deinococcus peraridilitoris DSM 19664]
MTTIAKQRLFYGWVVVAVTALVLLLAAGARSAPGVFLLPMQGDLGYSRATLSFAVSLGLIMFGLGGPISGALMDRFGPRHVTALGLLVTGVSFGLSALIGNYWQLYLLWGLLSGLGTGLVGSVLGATVATRWFVAKRGLVTGLFGAASSAGQLLFLPLLAGLSASVGWRSSTLVIGALALACLLPAWLLMRDSPGQMGERPLGLHENQALPGIRPDVGIMRRALRSRAFWLLATTFFVCGATSNGIIGTHFIAYCTEQGLTPGVAAGFLALMGVFNFVGTIASGALTDRYDPRALLSLYYAFRGVSLFLLLFIPPGPGLIAFAVLFGLDYIATVPPTVALVADTFGRGNVGIVYGWVFFAHMLGAALAAWLGGVARDVLGSYGTAFVAAAILSLAAGALSQGIRRAPKPALA